MKTKGLRPKRQRSLRRIANKHLERRLRNRGTRNKAIWTEPRAQFIPAKWEQIELAAPRDFSLIREPERLVAHLNDITSAVGTNRVIVSDLRNIEDFSTDALLCLIAFSNDRRFSGGSAIQGFEPTNAEVLDKFRDSGIYGRRFLRFADGAFRPAHGTIQRVNDKIVRGNFAREMIEFATLRIFGQVGPLKGVYTTMIECMNNTFNHAAATGEAQQTWWATVYCDTERRVAFFNFLDTGVGILESIRLKYTDRLSRLFGLKDNTEFLQEVLEGKIGSRTGLDYRGNGLPQIVKRFEMGQLSRLIIVSNDVYADLENNDYRILPKEFSGTFFHWEISYDRHYQQLEIDD